MKLYKKIRLQEEKDIDYSITTIIEIPDRWIVAQRENVSFSVMDNLLETSIDNSENFTKSRTFTKANKILNAYIFRNGNIMFTTIENEVYLTNFNLEFVDKKTVFDTDGVTPFPIHTPVNPAYPGRYFATLKYMSFTEETDIYVFSNYCNVDLGAAPVQIVYTKDFGKTFKVCYKFGVNLDYRDDGTPNGGATGTSLGDINNPIVVRHTHTVEYNPGNGKFYCPTGDHNDTHDEIYWMEGEYFPDSDTWNWQAIDFGFLLTDTSPLKAADINFFGDYVYYTSDATGATAQNDVNGVWRAPITQISDFSKHEKIIGLPDYRNTASSLKFDTNSELLLFTTQDVPGVFSNGTIGIAKDYGLGEVQYKTFTGYDFMKMNEANQKGFFRLDTHRTNTLQNKTFFIKPGKDLFNNL